MNSKFLRLTVIGCALSGFALLPSGYRAASPTVDYANSVVPFFRENCYFCHNAKKPSGGMNLEKFTDIAAIASNQEQFETIVRKIKTGEMPPKGLPRPDEGQSRAVTSFISGELERIEMAAPPDPGHVTTHRLNRAEYNNTVRDLLGVDLKAADDFPQDDSGYGFDNIGDVLSVSPVLMEKYLSAAEKISRTALFGTPKMKPTLTELRGSSRKLTASFTPLAEYDHSGLSLGNSMHVQHRFPVDGEYTFRGFLGGQRPPGSDAVSFAIWIDGKQEQVRALDPEGGASFTENKQDFDSYNVEFKLKISQGDHWIAISPLNLYDGLPASFNGPNPSRKVVKAEEFKIRPDLSAEINERRRKAFDERQKEKVPVNMVRVNRINIGGPYNQATGPSQDSLSKVYVCGHYNGKHLPSCGRKIVTALAHRAYRRQVSPQEVNQLLALVSNARRQGDSFEEGLNVAIQAMLVSPSFLFRIEPAAGTAAASAQNVQPINQYALASRLSYFLWSSMPDDELLKAADTGNLRKPEFLKAQVVRMLRDPKAKALAENFAGQWLELRRLESLKPDRGKFPDYDDYLKMSARKETELFFESIVREDGSLLDFIDGNYTFLNERLAELYHIGGVRGPEFRKVTLAPDTHRAGILTQSSILTVSSYTTRTSPVLRGKWILENVLNAPPPPPPPGVQLLDESKVGVAASLRQQLEEHRKNPTCASCHSRMDPLGFGLENFDAVGAWRVKDGGFAIDPSGVLPDGRTFKGPGELLKIIKADRAAFTRGLAEKLLTYALGRGMERYDRPALRKITSNVEAGQYRFSALVMEIVNSLPFQMQRGEKKS